MERLAVCMTRTIVALLVASIAAFPALAAGDARSADWSIPRPMSAPSPDRPAHVIDLTGAPYLQDGVRHAALLANDDLLLFGSGHGADRTTELSISVFDPASGAVETPNPSRMSGLHAITCLPAC